MNKFDKVNNSLIEATRCTNNWVMLTKNVPAGSKGKYTIENVITHHVSTNTFNTLNEVIKMYNLNV